ncbi:hypothetical protein ACEPAI_2563 [Sanghuangporus weigelae]
MNFYNLDIVAIAVALTCVGPWTAWRKRRANGVPLPPDERETARQWGKKYGDLVYIENFGTRYLFVNAYEAAVELFEKRGNMYSSRPSTALTCSFGEGFSDWFTGVMPYGDELKKSRQFLNMFFQRLLQNPDNFRDHIQHTAAETIVKIVYGYQIVEDDPYVALPVSSARLTVDLDPDTCFAYQVRHLPSRFPGITFHQIAEEGRKLSTAMYHEPFDKTKAMIADGTAEPSVTSKLLESHIDGDGNVLNEALIVKAAVEIQSTVSMLLTFLLAMILYPDAMKKGQDELGRAIGKNNLPTFDARPKLPYIEAIYHECLSCVYVAPVANIHLAEKDYIYNGYSIPAGTAVYPNSWAILRDPKRYPESEKFIPDRWLLSPGKERPLDPNKVAFGFGRRFFAENSVFIGIASILAVFNIEKALDENGVPITPIEDYTSNIVRQVTSPRSKEAVAAIYQAASSAK